VVLVFKSSI